MKKFLLSCTLLMVLLNGCSFTNPSPVTNSYFISFYPSFAENKGTKILKVEKPHFTRDLVNNAMEYEENGSIYEYAYNKWSSPVNEMLGNLLIQIGESSGVFKDALMASTESKSDFILESTVLSFRQQVKGQKANAIFEIKLSLINAHSKVLLDSKRFVYEEECKEFSAKGGVLAFELIIKTFDKDVKKWLRDQHIQ